LGLFWGRRRAPFIFIILCQQWVYINSGDPLIGFVCTSGHVRDSWVVARDSLVEAGSGCEAQVVLDGSCSSDADSTAGTMRGNGLGWKAILF
jgi:hypothetical protein